MATPPPIPPPLPAAPSAPKIPRWVWGTLLAGLTAVGMFGYMMWQFYRIGLRATELSQIQQEQPLNGVKHTIQLGEELVSDEPGILVYKDLETGKTRRIFVEEDAAWPDWFQPPAAIDIRPGSAYRDGKRREASYVLDVKETPGALRRAWAEKFRRMGWQVREAGLQGSHAMVARQKDSVREFISDMAQIPFRGDTQVRITITEPDNVKSR